jgi:UDP-N-acetylglucosamine 2-epimerase
MVGNSSSGLLEAPSFHLPVVNIGARQRGRLRAGNVLDCGCTRDEIAKALVKALSPKFRASLSNLVNPYGDGHAAERIAVALKNVSLNARFVAKQFHDMPKESGG